jgi:hypothetical protein
MAVSCGGFAGDRRVHGHFSIKRLSGAKCADLLHVYTNSRVHGDARFECSFVEGASSKKAPYRSVKWIQDID